MDFRQPAFRFLTEKKADAAADRISAGIATERKRGTIKPFTGKLNELRR